MKTISLSQSQNQLLNQAKICLDNKKIEDRSGKSTRHSSRRASYLLDSTEEEKKSTRHRRQYLGLSKPTGISIDQQ